MDSRGGTRPTKVTFNRAGNVPNVASFAETNDENHEMHVKMSKKIAQLTKVIFSLNTKNDEFEEIIEGLRTTHRSELENVTVECKDKIVHYKQKLELVKEQETLINQLQNLLEDERNEKCQFIADFEKFKSERNQDENDTKSKYERKMTEIVSNLTKIRGEFENRTREFETAKKKYERERDNLVSDMTHRHSLEMETLMKAHRLRYDEVQNEKARLQKEMELFKSERSSDLSDRDSEVKNLVNEHEVKCEKLKKFYQSELAAAKQKQETEFNEKLEKLRSEDKLKQTNMKTNEEMLKTKVKVLNENKEKLEDKIERLEASLKSAKEELNKTFNNNDNYSKEVSKLQQELSVSEVRVNRLQNELNSLKGKCDTQMEDLLKKSGNHDEDLAASAFSLFEFDCTSPI